MASSSDESFVWTNASTGSDDSGDLNTANNIVEKKIKTKAQINQSDEEDLSYENIKESKIKKKKYKNESAEYNTDIDSPKKNKIKTERESDSDATIKKKKKKHTVSNGSLDNSFSHDDEYLNMKVKQEKEYESTKQEKSKKSKRSNGNFIETIDNNELNGNHHGEKRSKNKKRNDYIDNDISFVNRQESEEDAKEKSPKKKKSKKRKYSEQNDIEETLASENINMEIEYSKSKDYKQVNTNNKHSTNSISKTVENPDGLGPDSDNNDAFINMSSSEPTKPIAKSTSQRKPRLSDRIKFEEDTESDVHSDSHRVSQNNIPLVSSLLKRYLKENDNLQEISQTSVKDSEITDDDEIWILKCPHDVDINKLSNIDMNADNKCKIKINGESYCGNLEDSLKINVVSSSKNDYKIKNLIPNGIIHFRKRLPKPHFQEHNNMVNNQTDFIPLPETKCRHPLFGANYKDAINVPTERLNSSSRNCSVSDKKKKKKHKKDYNKEADIQLKTEDDSETSLNKAFKVKSDPEFPVKKAKKRKYQNEDEHAGTKSKRIKLEPDSAEAWASEKAIEENLFNF